MTDQEKSLVFARLLEFPVMPSGYGDPELWADSSGKLHTVNFYSPANMALAWQVLNWASVKLQIPPENELFTTFYTGNGWWTLFCAAPADAQRLFLDKILELAIEAGIVEVNDGRS